MRITETKADEPFVTTHKWLRHHNAQHATDEFSPLRLLAHDEEGEMVGSFDGMLFWRKLHVDNLVIQPGARRSGIGTQLMQAAENLAKQKDCTGIYLDTMSFQALEFYMKLGFKKAGEIDGFENESTLYLLHKRI